MKMLVTSLLMVALCGCEAARRVAPQTTAGFETGGVLGALDGATGAVLARCRTLDGALIRVAIDDVAALTGSGSTVNSLREARIAACARARAVAFLVDVVDGTDHDSALTE